MTPAHHITINGIRVAAKHGALLLDAALSNGIDLPYDCRSGHCGTCCVRLISGNVQGGHGAEPGIVHACQCRIAGDVVVESCETSAVRSVEGQLLSVRALSPDVMEIGIKTDRALPHHAGQYAQVCFAGYPSRPFSITHPLRSAPTAGVVWFHVRRMQNGHVTTALGKRIKPGHKLTLTGPYGSAHFRSGLEGRLILVATNTGFAPIWSIAAAALHEMPERRIMIIAGGRSIEALYMHAALARLASFPNVLVVPVCSSPQALPNGVMQGRPTDYLPLMLPTDVVYACGAPGMVEAVKAIAANFGAVCYADPFMPAAGNRAADNVLKRAVEWLAVPASKQARPAAPNRPRVRLDQSLRA